MPFSLGRQSLAKLAQVHPDLVRVVKTAIGLSTQDFRVENGLRSDADQLAAFKAGNSKLNGIAVGQTVNGIKGTGRGNHQANLSDGLSHAVDLTPWVKGKILWAAVPGAQQWSYIYPVAAAMRSAAIAEKVTIRWGGVWDKMLNDLRDGAAALEKALGDYKVRHAGPDFVDGPHYEIKL